MARIGVTRDEVEFAAQCLIGNKKPVTVLNIRAELGNRGSCSTISRHLKEWKNEAISGQFCTEK